MSTSKKAPAKPLSYQEKQTLYREYLSNEKQIEKLRGEEWTLKFCRIMTTIRFLRISYDASAFTTEDTMRKALEKRNAEILRLVGEDAIEQHKELTTLREANGECRKEIAYTKENMDRIRSVAVLEFIFIFALSVAWFGHLIFG